MKVIHLLSGLVLSFIVACQHAQVYEERPLDLVLFWKDQKARLSAASDLMGSIQLRFQGPEQSLSGKGVLITHLDQSGPAHSKVYLDLKDPLGKVRYQMALKGGKQVAYYPTENLAYLDREVGRKYLRRFVGVDLDFHELQQLWLGAIPAEWLAPSWQAWVWDPSLGVYRSRSQDGKVPVEMAINPRNSTIVSMRVVNRGKTFEIHFEDFEDRALSSQQKPLGMPQVIRLASEDFKMSYELKFKDQKFKKPETDEAFAFTIPEGTRRVVLK